MTTIESNIAPPTVKKSHHKKKPDSPISQTLQQERTVPPVHESRSYQTWDDVDIHSEENKPWTRGSSLEAPEARPGFGQRWIRVGADGRDDPTNTARKFREGWKPRPAASLPASYHAPTIGHGKWAGCIGVEGMLLCEMPLKMIKKRNDHFAGKTDAVTNAIERELQGQSSSKMPITQERSSTVKKNVRIQTD